MGALNKILERFSLAARVLFAGNPQAVEARAISPITPEEVAEAQSFFPMPKFFIFGHARSGTTLLARLVRVHPEVHCNWQGHFFTRPPLLSGMASDPEVAAWLARPSNRWNRGRDLTPVVLRAVADYLLERDARREGKRVVGDKSPNVLTNGEAVRHMHSIYPDAHLIFIVRDGRDALLSHRFQNFIDGPQFLPREDLRIRDDFARRPDLYFAGQRSIFTPAALRRMADGWVRNVGETHELGQQLYGGRYFSLRFEDLLKDPYEHLARLWEFLGVNPAGLERALAIEMDSNPDAEWQRQKAGELVAPLEKGRRGSWRELFTPRDKQVFKEIAGKTLIAWGYEQGTDW